MNKLFISITILFAMSCFGQNSVILKKSIDINISHKYRGLSIDESHFKSTEILTKNTLGLSDAISKSNLDKLVFRSAWTEYKNTKGKPKKLYVDNWETSSLDRRGIFFSGVEKVSFDYPKAEKGSICYLKYEKEISDPQFLSSFHIVENAKIKECNFTISYPKDVEIELAFLNTDSLEIIEEVDSTLLSYTKTITLKNIPEFKYIDKVESTLYYLPHILIRIKSYVDKGEKISIGESTKDLFNWYSKLVKEIPEAESEEYVSAMNLEVGNIINGLNSEEEKVEKIFNWVQKNIKYIAFEDGMNGFIPRNAYNILHNRYGDCKDMANLTKTMLESAGIESYLTWIGTRSKPYTYDDVPSIVTDNHMICSAKINGKILFLDATNENVEFKANPLGIQGKQALIALSDTSFILKDVPVSDKYFSERKDSFDIHLLDNELLSSFSSNLSGYFNEKFVYVEQLGKFRRDESFYLDYLNVGSDGYQTSDPKIEKSDKEVRINLLAKFQNKIISAGSKLYISLNFNDLYDNLNVEELEKRLVDIHEDHKYVHSIHSVFHIPQNYKLSSQLSETKFEHPLFSYHQTFTPVEGKISVYQKLELNFIELKKQNFKDYKMFLKTLKKIEQFKLKFEKQ